MKTGRVHFIVGMSLCGITQLSRALNLHPDIAVFGETRFFGRCYVKPKTRRGYSGEQLDRLAYVLRQFRFTATVGDDQGCLQHLSLDGLRELFDTVFSQLEPPVAPGPLFTAIAEAVADAEGKRYAFEKTPHHLNWIDRIVAHVPGTHFVVLLCDPYTFARFHRRYDPLYHPVTTAVLWRAYMRSYERAARRHGGRMVVVSVDELVYDGASALDRILGFFELETHDLSAPLAPLRDAAADETRGDDDSADVFWINLLCGPLMRRHGYSRRPVIGTRPDIVGSAASLPRWCTHTLPRAKGKSFGSTRYLLRWLRP